MFRYFQWLSIALASWSFFMLVSGWWGIEINHPILDVRDWYERTVYPIVEVLEPVVLFVLDIVHLELPKQWQDYTVLYLLFAGSFYRFVDTSYGVPPWYWKVLYANASIVWPALLGYIIGVRVYGLLARSDYFSFQTRFAIQMWAMELLKATAGLILLLLANAGLR